MHTITKNTFNRGVLKFVMKISVESGNSLFGDYLVWLAAFSQELEW